MCEYGERHGPRIHEHVECTLKRMWFFGWKEGVGLIIQCDHVVEW